MSSERFGCFTLTITITMKVRLLFNVKPYDFEYTNYNFHLKKLHHCIFLIWVIEYIFLAFSRIFFCQFLYRFHLLFGNDRLLGQCRHRNQSRTNKHHIVFLIFWHDCSGFSRYNLFLVCRLECIGMSVCQSWIAHFRRVDNSTFFLFGTGYWSWRDRGCYKPDGG